MIDMNRLRVLTQGWGSMPATTDEADIEHHSCRRNKIHEQQLFNVRELNSYYSFHDAS
jgi:hypothetical protein